MDGHTQHQHGHRFTGVDRLRSPERLARLEVDRVVDLALNNIRAQTVIDIGTGTGVFAEAFSRRGLAIHGIDTNPEMLDTARRFVPEGIFEESPAERLPYADGTFDLAYMGLVLHETDHLSKALAEAYRVTRQRLAVLEWPYLQQDFGPGLEERLQPDQVLKLAAQAGFSTGEVLQLQQLVLYRFTKDEKSDEE
jgi:ubiquinone/menaquinone biosynthesis C-methylase UbiE